MYGNLAFLELATMAILSPQNFRLTSKTMTEIFHTVTLLPSRRRYSVKEKEK
jgi:hypothetical protein